MNDIAKSIIKDAYSKFVAGTNRHLAMMPSDAATKEAFLEALNYLSDNKYIMVLAKSIRFWECKLTDSGKEFAKTL